MWLFSSIWDDVHAWLKIPHRSTTLLCTTKWNTRLKQDGSILIKAKWVTLAATIYYIWKFYNLVAFESKRYVPLEMVAMIKH